MTKNVQLLRLWYSLILIFFISMSNYTHAVTCAGASLISGNTTFPSSSFSLTCGAGNDITSANATACGSSAYYGGQEALFQYTPNSNIYNFVVNYTGVSWTGIFIFQGCPTSGGTCLTYVTNSATSKSTNVINLTTGITYYIMIDTWPTPNSPCPGSITLNGSLCNAIPTAGFARATLPCAASGTTNLSITGGDNSSTLTFQWQSSPDDNNWSDIVGATATTYSTTVSSPIYFRRVTTCPLSGSSNSESVFASPNPNTYSNPIYIGELPCAGSAFTNTQNLTLSSCFSNGYTGAHGWSGPEVWYKFILPVQATIQVSQCASNFDTYIHITAADGTTELAYNDDNGPFCATSRASLETNLPAGTYYIVAEGFNGATGIITTTVNIKTPAGTPSSSNPTISGGCGSTNITLTPNYAGVIFNYIPALTSGNATGFSPGSGNTIVQNLSNPGSVNAVVTYTVTPHVGSCIGTPFTVVVTITPDAVVPVIANVPANITVSNAVGACNAVVTWASATATDNCSGATISPSIASGSTFPLGTTTVTYTAIDGQNNTSTASFTVTVNDTQAPVLTVPGTQSAPLDNMCQMTVPDLAVLSSASDICSGVTFTQSPLAGSTVVGSAPVTVTITATDAYSNSVSNTVTVNPVVSPATVTASGPTTFCDGENVWLITPSNAAYTYQWFNNNVIMPSETNDSILVVASGSYHVEVTITGACTMVSAPTVVTEHAVPPAPTVSITSPAGATSPLTICAGVPVTLAYSGGAAANQFVWYLNGTLVNYTLSPSSTYSSNSFLNGANDLALRAVYSAGPTCLSAPTSVTVNKIPLPVASISMSGPANFCANTPTVLTANPTGSYTYGWKRSTTSVGTNATYIPIASGNHRLLVSDINGCTGQSAWLPINVLALPIANAGVDKNLCVGASVQIGSTNNAANSYAWMPTTALSNPNISNPMTSATTNMQYVLQVSNISTGCSKTDTMNLTSLAQPASPSLAIQGSGASSSTVCEGTSITLVPTAVGTANLWYKNNVLTTVKLPGVTTVLTASSTVAEVYTITTRDANNCVSLPSNAITALINANPIPSISPIGTSNIISVCLSGQPTATQVLTANTPVGAPAATFTWDSYISGIYTNVGSGNTFTATVGSAVGQSTKTYRLSASYATGCSRNSSNKTVKVQSGCKGDGSKDNANDIIEITTDNEVMLTYPNPTSSILNVEISHLDATNGKLLMYNALGQVVLAREIMLSNGKGTEVLDLSEVAAGIYTLSFQTDKTQHTHKVVKE